MRRCGCEYLLIASREYLALLLDHEAFNQDVNLDYAYELLDRLTEHIGE